MHFTDSFNRLSIVDICFRSNHAYIALIFVIFRAHNVTHTTTSKDRSHAISEDYTNGNEEQTVLNSSS